MVQCGRIVRMVFVKMCCKFVEAYGIVWQNSAYGCVKMCCKFVYVVSSCTHVRYGGSCMHLKMYAFVYTKCMHMYMQA